MTDELKLESSLLHMVRPQDLNHHGTLFAGQAASWLVEAGFIAAARLCGNPEDIVCVKIDEMTFRKPINLGDVIEIKSRVAFIGATSISIVSRIFRGDEKDHIVSNMATFVTVNKENKPYAHGLKLPAEYIEKNRDIYNEAIRTRKGR